MAVEVLESCGNLVSENESEEGGISLSTTVSRVNTHPPFSDDPMVLCYAYKWPTSRCIGCKDCRYMEQKEEKISTLG